MVISLLITLLLGDFLLGFVAPQTKHEPRFLVWSSPSFRVDQFGAVTYLPNETVRTVAVYGDEIEYDVIYKTNNMGLIDHRDYDSSENADRRLVFVGDSFTAGEHGGKPWVPQMRDRLEVDQKIAIYNLGVSGASIHHFAKILDSFTTRIAFDEIVVLGISDDFLRRYWVPDKQNSEIRFCDAKLPIERCRFERRPVGFVIEYDTPVDRIVDQARNTFSAGFWDRLTIMSHFAGLVDRTLTSHQTRKWGTLPRWQQDLFESNMESLGYISTRFPDKKRIFIQLPQKEEVAMGEYEFDLENAIEAQGFEYISLMGDCSWSLDMFLEKDGHPNQLGYENIERCVAEALSLRPSQSLGESL